MSSGIVQSVQQMEQKRKHRTSETTLWGETLWIEEKIRTLDETKRLIIFSSTASTHAHGEEQIMEKDGSINTGATSRGCDRGRTFGQERELCRVDAEINDR